MTNIRYLTKSRFKLALECPTKLFYTGKREFPDQKLDDPFLAALANGGFQVGELAKCYFPEGVEVVADRGDYDGAVARTNDLLQQENVTIFEAAVRHENLFIRIDVLVKKGNSLELIEVKSKSYDDDTAFFGKKGSIDSKWKPYLYDVAFQKYVVQNAFPGNTTSAFLMLADKSATCPTDGLNQKFRIYDEDGKKGARLVGALTPDEISNQILRIVCVDDECERIFDGTDEKEPPEMPFGETVEYLAGHYQRDEMIEPVISRECRNCQFTATREQEVEGLLSGYKACWKRRLGWTDADFDEPTALNIWNLHFTKKDKLISSGRLKMSSVDPVDIGIKESDKSGISPSERQWLQVEKVKNTDLTPFIDVENLRFEMQQWKFPLHFIDFETATPAIPFNRGRRPYEGIAFQFSHHLVHEDGRVEHAGEYLNTNVGEFPNYEFVRKLKDELSGDKGSIFRYATHENTYLNTIHAQLNADESVPDRAELCEFIESITHLRDKKTKSIIRKGERDMIDLLEIVKRFYYDPRTKGSNSIKYVLPAILNSSESLKTKYSKPIYGAAGDIRSLNFTDQTWIEEQADGTVRDPYSMLGNVFEGMSDHDFEMLELDPDESLKDGGAAMIAYARLQFEDLAPVTRTSLEKALLRYCELDTLAMVMIYEGWRDMVSK